MSNVRPTYDDEIDLFEFFETLWDGKWLISAFVAIAVLLGGGFLLLKDAVYESKLVIQWIPSLPFMKQIRYQLISKISLILSGVFEEWKKNNSDTSLMFEDFSCD